MDVAKREEKLEGRGRELEGKDGEYEGGRAWREDQELEGRGRAGGNH